MTFAKTFALALLLALPACADPEVDPTSSLVLEGPELSMPREERKTADPPPPIRERRLDTTPESSRALLPPVFIADPASIPSTAATAAPGTVNELRGR